MEATTYQLRCTKIAQLFSLNDEPFAFLGEACVRSIVGRGRLRGKEGIILLYLISAPFSFSSLKESLGLGNSRHKIRRLCPFRTLARYYKRTHVSVNPIFTRVRDHGPQSSLASETTDFPTVRHRGIFC